MGRTSDAFGRAGAFRKSPRMLAALLAVAVGASSTGLALSATGTLRRAEEATVDTRFAERGRRPPMTASWSWPSMIGPWGARPPATASAQRQARALNRIAALRPRALGVDLEYRGATDFDNRTGELGTDDTALVEAIDKARPTVLATTARERSGRPATLNFVEGVSLRSLGATAGHAAFGSSAGGTFRRLPATADGLATFPVALAATAQRSPRDRRSPPSQSELIRAMAAVPRNAWIDFRGPRSTVPMVSLIDVLRHRPSGRRLRGRVVILGDTTRAGQDEHPTAYGDSSCRAQRSSRPQLRRPSLGIPSGMSAGGQLPC